MSKDDEEFTTEELRLGRLFLRVIYEFAIVLLITITVLTTYAGYWGWPWHLVIPIAAPLIFGARVLRRYFRELWMSVGRDLGDVRSTASPSRPRSQVGFRPTGRGAVAFVAALLLAISAFWYGVGVGVRMLLQLA